MKWCNLYGVIGLGHWGSNLLKNLISVRDASKDEIGACDVDIERLNVVKQLYPNVFYITDYETFSEIEELKAVLIATPVESHYEISKFFLEKGVDVFIEKPMTDSISQTEELIEIAEKNNAILMVGHILEYNPAVLKIEEIIKNGELGEILYITSTRVGLGMHRTDVNVLWDLASHEFSMIFRWTDAELVKASTVIRTSTFPDVAFVQMVFDDDMIANIQVGWLAPSKIRKTVIVGSKKMIVYDDLNIEEKIKIYDSGMDIENFKDFGEFLLSYRKGDICIPKLSNKEPLKEEILHFLECVKTRTKPRTDGWNALKVIKAIDMAERHCINRKLK